MNTTPASLLERLRRPEDQVAWERFVQLYTPLLCHWAHRLGLREADIADLVQDVFAVLVEKLPQFRYDPHGRFRAWLWTIVANKCRARQRRPVAWHQASERELAELPAGDDVAALSEAEYRRHLMHRALQLMQQDFQPATWMAFWECVVAGRAASDVAAELNLSLDAIYTAKSRVLRRLREQLDGLLD
jgi:RNA polymerase sigma-70 factor (ECF subfamily)